MVAIGLHAGSDMGTSQYDDFSAWLGRAVRYRVVFTGRNSWTDVANPFYLSATRNWLAANPHNVEVMSVPLLLSTDTNGFPDVSGGGRDTYFQSLASQIAAAGNPAQVIIRLGWEYNGNWFAWSALANAAGYVAAFRHVVSVMKAIAPALLFEWCSNYQNSSAFDFTTAYPGDDVVDVISVDTYDQFNTGWADILSRGGFGLTAIRAFANARGKPEAFTEWSCSTTTDGHGDNASFVRNMANWVKAGSNVLYHGYWNTPSGGPNAAIQGVGSGTVPISADEYRTSFSGGALAYALHEYGAQPVENRAATATFGWTHGYVTTE